MSDESNRAPDTRRPAPPSVPPRGRQGDDASGASHEPTAPRRVSTGMPSSRPAQARPRQPQRAARPATEQPRRSSPPPSIAPQSRDANRQAPAQADPAPTRPVQRQGATSATPAPASSPPAQPRRRKRHPVRNTLLVLLALLVLAVVWFIVWANGRINHVDALSGAADTPGRTYLIVGSDSRAGWDDDDPLEGSRTDTIMVLHKPESGPVALISIPRDAYVEIPGHNANKINAAFSFGGAPLLVETVEGVTNLTIDMYLEVGFTGVADMVDAVGGVNLCYDADVDDENSGMVWTAGCHDVDGEEALAFSRMRYSDPLGDIGRTERQRQVVGAVAGEVLSPATILNPVSLVKVTSAGLDAFAVSEGSGIIDLGRAALDLRSGLGGDAVTGTPPIRSMGFSVAGVGSTVLMDPDLEDAFWKDIEEGAFAPGETVGGLE